MHGNFSALSFFFSFYHSVSSLPSEHSRREMKVTSPLSPPSTPSLSTSLSRRKITYAKSQMKNKRDKKKMCLGRRRHLGRSLAKPPKGVVLQKPEAGRGKSENPAFRPTRMTLYRKKFHVFQLCASLCYLSLPAMCVFTSTSQQCVCV